MTDKPIIIDGVNVSECIHIDNWKHCNCCNDLIKTIYPKATKCHIEEDLRCEIYPNCYFKQLKRKEQKLERITNMLFIGQCSNCEGYSPNCSNKELCNFKHNIKNIIDEVENE